MNAILPNPEQQPLLDVDEVAAVFGVHRQTVYKLVADGELDDVIVHIGRKFKFSTAGIRRFVGLDTS